MHCCWIAHASAFPACMSWIAGLRGFISVPCQVTDAQCMRMSGLSFFSIVDNGWLIPCSWGASSARPQVKSLKGRWRVEAVLHSYSITVSRYVLLLVSQWTDWVGRGLGRVWEYLSCRHLPGWRRDCALVSAGTCCVLVQQMPCRQHVAHGLELALLARGLAGQAVCMRVSGRGRRRVHHLLPACQQLAWWWSSVTGCLRGDFA